MDRLKNFTVLVAAAFVLFMPVKHTAAQPTMWGAKFIVSHMSLNTTGFVSWLKVVNPGNVQLYVTGDIIWTLADGTEGSVSGASLGSVDPGGIGTIGEATILTAIGDPTQLADVSMVLYLANPEAIVVAEKKASDGRVGIPVERVYLLTDPSLDPSKPAPVVSIPKTGQTTSYATGDDGDLQAGAAWPDPRFTDNGDGTVRDNLTGLIWLKNANCANGNRDWATALSDVAQLNTDGTMNGNACSDSSYSGSHQMDWRLPTIKELFSLIDFANNPGSVKLPGGHPFTGVQYVYWSSTTIGGELLDELDEPTSSYFVSFDIPGVSLDDKVIGQNSVWAVRGPE